MKIKEMHSVRWFAFYCAIETVYRSWDALVTYFANHKNDAKAVGFLKKLTQVENVANSIFQKEDLDVSIIISTTLSEIAKVNEESGYYTKKLDESLKQDESGKWHMGAGGHEISHSET